MGFPRLFWCRTLSEPVCADHRSRMLFVDERSLRPPGHHRSRAVHILRRVPAPVRDVASANQRERAWFWARELLILPGLHCPRSPFFQSCMWRYSWSYIMCWPYSPYNTLLYTCRKSPRSVTRGGEGRGGAGGQTRTRVPCAFSTLGSSWHGLRCVEAKNVSQQAPHAHSVKVTRGSTPTRPSDCVLRR